MSHRTNAKQKQNNRGPFLLNTNEHKAWIPAQSISSSSLYAISLPY